jgi:hypothetical protein
LAHAIVDAEEPPPVLTAANQQVLEVVRAVDGTGRVLTPRAASVA